VVMSPHSDPAQNDVAGFTIAQTPVGFRVTDPKVGIHAEGRDLTDAYKALLDARAEVLGAQRAEGEPSWAVEDVPEGLVKRLRRAGLLLFVGAIVGMATISVQNRVGEANRILTAFGDARSAGKAMAGFVGGLADAVEGMSDERDRALHEDVRRIVRRTQPIVEELQPLLQTLFGNVEDRSPTLIDPASEPDSAAAPEADCANRDGGCP